VNLPARRRQGLSDVLEHHIFEATTAQEEVAEVLALVIGSSVHFAKDTFTFNSSEIQIDGALNRIGFS
jgi:hypothetical protein